MLVGLLALWLLMIPSAAPRLSAASAPASSPARLAAATATAAAVRAVAQAAPVSELSTIRVIVSRNDTLDHIFRRLALSLSDLASLRSLPGIRAHLDRLRPGETLTLTAKSGTLVGLERRLNIDQTLKVDRAQAGFTANVLSNPLATRTRTLNARIDSSLFESMTAAGGHDQTALSLANIFGYDIDFVLDTPPGRQLHGHLHRSSAGRQIPAGWPDPGGAVHQPGQGVPGGALRQSVGQRGLLLPAGSQPAQGLPARTAGVHPRELPFSLHRMHPTLNTIRAHKGVDYAAPIGTPVRAAGEGRVLFAGVRGGYGNLVELDHSRGITTVYGHLSRFAHGLHAGQHVSQGDVIAFVGMTGLATGPHLHYEYRVNGVFQNPQTVKLPEALPIDGPLRADFLAKSAPLLASLDPPPGATLVSR